MSNNSPFNPKPWQRDPECPDYCTYQPGKTPAWAGKHHDDMTAEELDDAAHQRICHDDTFGTGEWVDTTGDLKYTPEALNVLTTQGVDAWRAWCAEHITR